MENHTEILEKIAARVESFREAGGDVEEDLWPSASEVLREIGQILRMADPPVSVERKKD